MRTKNAKRLWPVPATLAVMAVAALLAFGLMATTGAQPAAAQSDPDCEIMVGVPNAQGIPASVTLPTNNACDAVGDTATVQFTGSAMATDDGTLSLLIEDKSGTITAYPNTTVWNASDGRLEVSSAATISMKYRFQSVTVPKAAQNPATGQVEGQKVTIMVQGDVYVWAGTTDVTDDVDNSTNIPEGNAAVGALEIADGGDQLNITYLGMPALGEDADTDSNKEVDDVPTIQCRDENDEDDPESKIVTEVAAGGTCPNGTAEFTVNPDDGVIESRSKLVAVATDGTPMELLDGGELEIDMGDADGVTIYAVIEDEDQNELMDTEVTFSATETPSGIIAPSDRTDEEDTEEFGTEVIVTGYIVQTDAVATFGLDDLADTDGSYRITIELTVGSLDLGTVILQRKGNPETIMAGVFNAACFMPGGDDNDDYELATFNDKNEGCTAMGDTQRFGAGEMIFVKAHLEDSLGSFVGDGTSLDSELANEDDDLLGDADMLTIEDPVVESGDPARAWVYTVDGDATLGDHMITVSTSAQNADKEDIDDVTVTVSVAGPPVSLSISGDANIELNGSVTYTVTAEDMKNGIPYFDRDSTDGTDRNDMVTVSVQPTDALVIGTNTAGQVMLDDDGTADFIVYAALDADDGDHGRIIARLGELQDIEPITFGLVLGMPGMPMDVMAMADGHDTINVSWEAPTDTGNSDITGYMVQRGSMDADNMMMWMDVDPAHMGMDMMYMDMGLMAETTYYYRVAAMNSIGMGEYSDGMAMAMTMAEDMPTDGEMLTSPSGVDAASLPGTGVVSVSWTPGQNATQHWVVLFSLPGYDAEGRVEVLNDPDANFQVLRNVPAGEYEVVVASYDPDMDFQYQDGIGMVTVE